MYVGFTGSILAAVVLAWASADAVAQSSKVILEPRPGDALMPVASMSLDIADADYPFDALLANEQGKVTLGFNIDNAGHPTNLEVVSSSGIPRLDQQAEQIARSRWTFQVSANSDAFHATVDWKLPLEVIDDYKVQIPAGPSGANPPVAVANHAVIAGDYPLQSIKAKEHGTVILRYAIKEDGSIGQIQLVQSSGTGRLDAAATGMIARRWKFEPARADGKPVVWWDSSRVAFLIIPDVLDKKQLHCYSMPLFAGEAVDVTATLISSRAGTAPAPMSIIERWTFVNHNGEASTVLLRTKAGLARTSVSLSQALKGSGYRIPGDANGCWYYDPLVLQR